jgi:non-specific serine/threonine protein kinase
MIGETVSHYRILEELGRGGMGVVYKAEDTRLKRTVALKFLSPELTRDETSKSRFIQEAQAASALQHNNICTIHEIDDTEDGHLFISMDYYDGETLKDKISRGPVPVDEAIDLVSQVAAGLSEAHAAGMVHRDIKPANIMVTDRNVVKILDFGLAKLAGQARLTKTGTELGTISYISPDQASGAEVDQRSDIFSLGVVMYELITGELPFKGDHDAAIVYSIMNTEPTRPSRIREQIPAEVEEIILKAMEKDPEHRYRLVDEVRTQLKLAGMAVEAGASVGSNESQPTIAVLPFTNMSADREQDYFCDGMAEDIINDLSKIEGLRVAARTSSFAFKGKSEDVRRIGRRLGVSTVLEGSVQKAGNRLRITIQLVNVRDGYHIWSQRYDRDLEDVFAIQDEIGRKIVEALEVRLTDTEKQMFDRVQTTDVEAYDFYLRGRQSFHRLGTGWMERARNLFMSAIIRDSEYCLAYCGLADCYSMLSMYFSDDKTNIENAVIASRKALELDPELAEARASHGLAISLDRQYDDAYREFEKAIQLSPRLYEAYYYWARTCWAQGDLEKAAELFEKAASVRPEDYQSILLAANAYRGLDRKEDFRDACRRGLEKAEAQIKLEPDDARAWYLGAQALCGLGERDKGIEWIRHALSDFPADTAIYYNAACVFSELGMFDEVMECFGKAIFGGFAHKDWIDNDPYFENVRRDPRFSKILENL